MSLCERERELKLEKGERERDMGESSGYKDYVAGMLAGVATVIVGHPFDTVKVFRSGSICFLLVIIRYENAHLHSLLIRYNSYQFSLHRIANLINYCSYYFDHVAYSFT